VSLATATIYIAHSTPKIPAKKFLTSFLQTVTGKLVSG
jgi:hypothetical protein